MNSIKVKLAVLGVGALALLAFGIFVFIKLSLVNVPTTTFTRKDTQKLSVPYSQISRIFKWNQKIFVAIGPYNEFRLFVLESNNRLEPFHRISPDLIVLNAEVDRENRLIVSGVQEGRFCINVFSSDKKIEVSTKMPKRLFENSYTGVVQAPQINLQTARALTSKKLLYWLNEPDGNLFCWDIHGDSPKQLLTIFLPKIAKLATPLASESPISNFWRISDLRDDVVVISDNLGNFKQIDLNKMQISKKALPPPTLFDLYIRDVHKDKLGRVWEIRDLPTTSNEIRCEVSCLDGKKVVHRSMVHGTRDGQNQNDNNFVESVFGAFHFHNLKKSDNWNFPPTSFCEVLEDKLGNMYLRTRDEGFFKLVENKWERYSSPAVFSGSTQTLVDGDRIILSNGRGQILTYHLTDNTCESLDLPSESDPYNHGPGLVGYPVKSLRMESVGREHPQQVYPRYSN